MSRKARKWNPDYDKRLQGFLIPLLRRKSLHWPDRQEAKRKARVRPGYYKCASCGNVVHDSQTNMDHILPVINVKTSFTTWDSYIRSLLSDVNNWNCLCITCHGSKTAVENEMRSINKKKNKVKKK